MICPDCKADPCDCNLKIWGYWWVNKPGKRNSVVQGYGDKPVFCAAPLASGNNNNNNTRREMELSQSDSIKRCPDVLFGPLQRRTDPPYDFNLAQQVSKIVSGVLAVTKPTTTSIPAKAAEDSLWKALYPRIEPGNCICGCHKSRCTYHRDT